MRPVAALIVLFFVVTATAEAARRTRSRPNRVMTVSATAYCKSGPTASGDRPQRGTVAADPRVLPLGTRLRLRGQRGIYRVQDDGGGIRGRRIDIFMPSCRDARQFGRRQMQITVLADD